MQCNPTSDHQGYGKALSDLRAAPDPGPQDGTDLLPPCSLTKDQGRDAAELMERFAWSAAPVLSASTSWIAPGTVRNAGH